MLSTKCTTTTTTTISSLASTWFLGSPLAAACTLLVALLTFLLGRLRLRLRLGSLPRQWRHSPERGPDPLPRPPGPPGWPLLGSLPLLAGTNPHQKLAEMAQSYGTPVLGLSLGSKDAVVVCTAGMAREFLQKHDSAFSDRPRLGMVDHLLYGPENIVGFQSTGHRWRHLRQLWTTRLLSQAQLAKNRHVRQEEVAHMLAAIFATTLSAKDMCGTNANTNTNAKAKFNADAERHVPGALNVLTCAGHVTGNIMGRLLLSQRLFDSVSRPHPILPLIEDTLNFMFTPLLGDFLPSLSWLDWSAKRRMSAHRARVTAFFGQIVADRLRKKENNTSPCSAGASSEQSTTCGDHGDILDILLQESSGSHDSFGFINGTLLEMFIAGVDTSANTVTWAMAELLHNPDTMKKVQKELEEVVGLDRIVLEADLPKLHYLKAVIKETFRLHPIAVMMIPHVSKEDCNVANKYFIRADTRVFVNLWAIGRDPLVWGPNAHQFLPERFEGSLVDVKGQHFQLLPFGSGRRMCPGMGQGLLVVELTLANLLHSFNWSPIDTSQPIDLSESKSSAGSLTLATPLMAMPSLRLRMPSFPFIKLEKDVHEY